MVNYVESRPLKALPDNDSSSIVITLYDKEFPIMSIMGNRPERDKLLIFQDCGQVGRRAENGCLTLLQWISKICKHPYNESLKQLVEQGTSSEYITSNTALSGLNRCQYSSQ